MVGQASLSLSSVSKTATPLLVLSMHHLASWISPLPVTLLLLLLLLLLLVASFCPCLPFFCVKHRPTGIQVTINQVFSPFSIKDLAGLWAKMNLFGVVLAFEICLRLLNYFNVDKQGRPRFALLTPVYYCLITPVFYVGLFIIGVPLQTAHTMGYFFPQISSACANVAANNGTATAGAVVSVCAQPTFLNSVFNESLFNIWRSIDWSTISWIAILKSVPILIALAAFSIVHVPINIPAIAVSMDMGTSYPATVV